MLLLKKSMFQKSMFQKSLLQKVMLQKVMLQININNPVKIFTQIFTKVKKTALFCVATVKTMVMMAAPAMAMPVTMMQVTIVTVLCAVFSPPLYAAIDLELTQGVDSARPIAIMPLMGEEAISDNASNVRAVVGKDLENSGRFKLANVTGLLPALGAGGGASGGVGAAKNGGSVAAGGSTNAAVSSGINYDFWRDKKVENVVIGDIKRMGRSDFQISFKLFDVYGKAMLLDRQYSRVPSAQLRTLAHHVSDLIYEKLTGERGIFSTKIAYVVVQRSGGVGEAVVAGATRYSLELADVDGYNPRTLLTSDQPIMSPAWSPDGKKIAYVSFEGNRAAIYVQDVATGQRQVVSKQPGLNSAPAWSPDGKKLAVVLSISGYPKIYVMSANGMGGGSGSGDGGATEQITSDWYLDTEPNWAKDGQSILFTSNRGGTPQIYRVYLASKKVERVTYAGSYNARASFTADGKNIVMLHQDGGAFNIALQDLATGRMSTLTRSDFNESPSVAPNGKMVAYASNAGGRGVLAMVSSDGKVKLLLPALQGEVQEPAWSPFLE